MANLPKYQDAVKALLRLYKDAMKALYIFADDADGEHSLNASFIFYFGNLEQNIKQLYRSSKAAIKQ